MYYRNCSSREIFYLFRQGKLPINHFVSHKDSDAPSGRISFWFDKPVDVGRDYPFIIGSNIQPHGSGYMRYTDYSRNYDGEWDKTNFRIREYYLFSDTKLSSIKEFFLLNYNYHVNKLKNIKEGCSKLIESKKFFPDTETVDYVSELIMSYDRDIGAHFNKGLEKVTKLINHDDFIGDEYINIHQDHKKIFLVERSFFQRLCQEIIKFVDFVVGKFKASHADSLTLAGDITSHEPHKESDKQRFKQPSYTKPHYQQIDEFEQIDEDDPYGYKKIGSIISYYKDLILNYGIFP